LLRRRFGLRREVVPEGLRKPHNDDLHNLYSSPDIDRVIKSRMGCAGHVACMGRREIHTKFGLANLNVRDHMGDQGGDGRMVLKLMLKK